MKENPQTVNSAASASTSDGIPRSNALTADQWLERVLYSGQVTRVAQHLALVIFALAHRQQKNGINASLRDLERITGWGRSTLSDHLAELDAFIHVELAAGRGKSFFELQGMIEDAIGAALASGVMVKFPDKTSVVANKPDAIPDAIVASQPDTNVVAAQPDAIPDTNRCGQPAGHKPAAVVVSQPDISKERSPPIPPSKENNKHTQTAGACASPPGPGFSHLGHGAWVNCEKIWHPSFSISVPAVRMQLGLSVDTQSLDCVAICKSAALQWAAAIEGGQKPREVLPQNIVGAIVGGARRGVYSGLEHKARVAATGAKKPWKPSRWAQS